MLKANIKTTDIRFVCNNGNVAKAKALSIAIRTDSEKLIVALVDSKFQVIRYKDVLADDRRFINKYFSRLEASACQ